MHFYWKQNKDLIKSIIKGTIAKASSVKDVKKNLQTGEYDYLLEIGSGFDTETSRITIGEIDSAYVYHWQYSFGKLEVLGRSLKEFDEFFDFLLDSIPNNKKIITYVANLGYDYYFIKYHLQKYSISKHFEKSTKNPLIIEIGNKIILREVIGLFGKSLEHIANVYTKTKKLTGDLDFSLCRLSKTPMNDEEISYCVNDVKILSELGDYVFKNYFEKGKSLPLTAISELREDVKKEMGKDYFQIKSEIMSWMPDDEDEYYLFRNWLFKGGLCGTNSLYMNRHLKNVYHADFDSHYPACMNHFLFPMGKAIRTSPKNFLTEKKPYIAVIKFVNLKAKTCHSILSIHKALDCSLNKLKDFRNVVIDNGRIWRAGEATFVVNDVEFAYICKAYDFDIELTQIIMCWEFEKYARLPYYLLNVLNREYEKKTVLKRTGKSGTQEYEFSKNKVNGTFGMCCTALYADEFEIDDYGEILPKRNENGTRYKKDYEKAKRSVFLSPYWGMWITSYARSLLVNFITKFPNCIIQYDTDSIFFTSKNNESKRLIEYIEKYNSDCINLNNEIFENNESFIKLGTFELDDELMIDFKGLGSKRYMYSQYSYDKKTKEKDFKINTVIAGCRKGTVLDQFEFDTKLNPYDNINKLFNYFKDGMKIDKEHSKKLSSTYISKYGANTSIKVIYKDYKGNAELITLESAVVLKPVEFNMGLSDDHIRFYMTIQNAYNNTPSKYAKIFDSIIETFEIDDVHID